MEVKLELIGQMVSAVNTLHIFPTEEKAAEFLLALSAGIPGCLRAGLCFRGSGAAYGMACGAQCGGCPGARAEPGGPERYSCALPGQDGIRAYPLETPAGVYGYFVLAVGNAAEYGPYEPFMKNLANSLALVLENRRQQRELKEAAESLERRVRERTAELKELAGSLERRVADRTAKLDEANRELEAFSWSVSHDLQAPLRHAGGYADLLAREFQAGLPEKAEHYMAALRDSVRQMGELINDLLQLSRTGRAEMRRSAVDMNEVLRAALDPLLQANAGRRVDWVIAKFPPVSGDEALLKLVWTNLLDNALKFTRKSPAARIEAGFREEGGEFVFFVRDNGVGFDMRYARNLFGVFQRLHPAGEFEGTGIGLANVRRIISRHGGRTWAEAEPEKGAAFYFSLPKNEQGVP